MILAIHTQHAQSEMIATIMTIAIICALIFGLASRSSGFSIPDKIDIGYISEPVFNQKPIQIVNQQVDEVKELERQVKIARLKKQLQELQKPEVDSNLINDCIDTLVGLGTTKRKAKAEVEIIFDNNPNIKTVQEFITEYGKR